MSLDPNSRIAGFSGTLERPAPLLELTADLPWGARVTVTAMPYRGVPDQKYEVAATWVGPPLAGTPTPRDGQLTSAGDLILLEDLALARQVAHLAHRKLRAGTVPDLFALSGQRRISPVLTPSSTVEFDGK